MKHQNNGTFSAKELENISEKEADKRKDEEITLKNGLYTKISSLY